MTLPRPNLERQMASLSVLGRQLLRAKFPPELPMSDKKFVGPLGLTRSPPPLGSDRGVRGDLDGEHLTVEAETYGHHSSTTELA
jgi:hypothetical protein